MNRAAVDPVTVALPQLVSLAFPVAAVAGCLPAGQPAGGLPPDEA
jgi:hypothetical protein